MEKRFFKNIPYTLIFAKRKTLTIIIRDGEVIVRAPKHCLIQFIENFLEQKSDWIVKNLQISQKKLEQKKALEHTEDIRTMKQILQKFVENRVEYFWRQTNFPKYTSIRITQSKKRWWSCSSKNSLNFSYKLAHFLEKNPKFVDAVIVHEICHLVEKNHQKRFWNLVITLMPDYHEVIKSGQMLDVI